MFSVNYSFSLFVEIEEFLPFQAFLRPFAVPLYSFRAKKALLHLNATDPFTVFLDILYSS